jgi:hypothetical protein
MRKRENLLNIFFFIRSALHDIEIFLPFPLSSLFFHAVRAQKRACERKNWKKFGPNIFIVVHIYISLLLLSLLYFSFIIDNESTTNKLSPLNSLNLLILSRALTHFCVFHSRKTFSFCACICMLCFSGFSSRAAYSRISHKILSSA